jgi:hypothetical protein
MGKDWLEFNSLFKKLKPLIEDFSKKSNFRKFYKNNLAYYQELIERQQKNMPVRQMWTWLEDHFVAPQINAYKVIFSPLIRSSHSTQQFAHSDIHHDFFWEIAMFVSGPNVFDNSKSLSEKQVEGLASGIVFTEIDHNYVNPVSSKYSSSIDSIFSDRTRWASQGGDTKNYPGPMEVFNEYMTHALFSLYIIDNYDKPTADFIISERESLMVERRHYVLFREFNKALIELYRTNKPSDATVLFPMILDWCKQQNN